MSSEWIAVIAFLVSLSAIATFFIGRQTAAKSSGQEWGELKTDIGYIKRDVGEIKLSMAENKGDVSDAIAKEGEERRASIRRIHERIDDHLSVYHKATAPFGHMEE